MQDERQDIMSNLKTKWYDERLPNYPHVLIEHKKKHIHGLSQKHHGVGLVSEKVMDATDYVTLYSRIIDFIQEKNTQSENIKINAKLGLG